MYMYECSRWHLPRRGNLAQEEVISCFLYNCTVRVTEEELNGNKEVYGG